MEKDDVLINTKNEEQSFVSNYKCFFNSFDDNTIFILFLSVWFIINTLQAVFTEIHPDEAFYALYARRLAWGYADHPPLVAVLIYLSSLCFKGNLGVRFFTIVLQPCTLIIVWLIIRQQNPAVKKPLQFFIVAFSLVMFSVYGFITTPDAPLLFFAALFLFSYSYVLKENSCLSFLCLSVSMSGLVYSKEHGLLLIIFVVLSNLRLLGNFKFWTAVLLALVLISPHFWWHYSNGFPSFKYYLADIDNDFKWKYILEYIPNQLVVFNPITLGAVLFILLKIKPKNIFERAQYFIIIGFFSFFAFASSGRHAEPHWTVTASIPMIILLISKSAQDLKLSDYINKYIAPTLILILITRILLVTNLLPEKIGFHGKQAKYEAIEKVAGSNPVIFNGSYQAPSLYTFFTGKKSAVISSLYSRQTQFDIWQEEQKYLHQKVFVCIPVEGRAKEYQIGNQTVKGFFTDNLQTTNRIKIFFENPLSALNPNDSVSLNITIYNPTAQGLFFNHPEFPAELCAAFIKGKEVFLQKISYPSSINSIASHKGKKLNIRFTVPDLAAGKYRFGITLNSLFGPTLNSTFVTLNLK